MALAETSGQAAERQVLRGHVPAAVANLQPIDRLPASTNLSLAIGLPLRNKEELTNLIHEIYDPASTNYHRYLTPEQFTARFGPTPEDYQALIHFVTTNKLTITGRHPNRMLVDVNGTVADLERAFQVRMNVYKHPKENRNFFATSVEPSVPSALSVLDISGLNNYHLPHPKYKISQSGTSTGARPKSGSGPQGNYIGNDFRAAYVPGTSLTGAGQTIGLLQFDGYLQSDIAAYEALAGLPNVPLQNVLLDGFNGVPTGNGGELEVSLDIEMSVSMAPGLSQIIVYEAGPFGFQNDILNRMATDNAARQLSCSWGWTGGPQASTDQIFQQIAAQGQTFFDASGDDDAFGPGAVDDPNQPGAPSDNPYITQVGGTTLTTTGPGGAWVSETVWNWGTEFGPIEAGVGSSGGISSFYPIPVWQQGVNMASNGGSTTFRNFPDVALTADNVYVIADNGTPNTGVGGTSCAAPLWAGFTALVNQQATSFGEAPVGFINPAIYAIGTGLNYGTDFHDITTGNDTNTSSPTLFFATSGFDLCTGWGTPVGTNLINALAPLVPAPVLTVYTNIISGGNGNGIIDPDECNQLYLVLTNAGQSNATTILTELSTTTPGVLIVQPTSTYPNIPSGGAGTNLTAFKISTSPVFVCGSPVDLTMVVKSDQAIVTNQFSLNSGSPGIPVRFDNNSPVFIPDNSAFGANSVIVVSNITTTLMHVAVSLDILQPFVGDLTLQLISPDGTTNTLAQNNGGLGQNFGLDCNSDADRTTFDDNSITSINAGTPPFVGTYQPSTPLSVFIGKSGAAVNGAWKLQAVDPFNDSPGAIECWSLILTPAGCTDGGGQCPGVDLALGMAAGPNPVILGNTLTYVMTVTNNGPNTATGVALNQTLPSNVQIVSASSSQGLVSTNSGNVTCNLGIMPVGSTATVAVVVFPTTAGIVFSTATVGSQQDDFNLANNTVTVGAVVQSPTADLAIGLRANPSPVLVGGIFNYTVSVTNNGPSTASGVVVTNTLPLNVSLISAGSSQGICSSVNNLVICSLGSLNQGSNATATIQVRALNVGTITATSAVSANQTDPAPGNNTASITTTVTPAADLSLSMSGPPSVIIGSNVTYQLTVQNLGPSPATGVDVNDTLPAGVTLVSITNLQGTSSVTNGIVSCVLTNSLVAGGSATMSITINTSPLNGQVPVTIVNSASVAADQADPNSANNSASASTLVDFPRVNIVANGATLIGVVGPPTNGMINPAQVVTINFSLQNIGNINASNVFATLLGTGGIVTNSPQAKSYGTLAPAASAPAQFVFAVNATNGATITATLQLSGGATNQVKFNFVLPSVNTFANTNNIIIPDHGPATNGYPSPIVVSGLNGLVGRVTVTLTNVNHTYPDDIDMLLVGPGGQNVLLESHAGGGGVLTNVSLIFDDYVTNSFGARNFLPSSSQILSGTYVPSQYGTVNLTNNFGGTIQIPQTSLPPAQPFGTNLSTFNGTSPNGTWELYVFDESPGDQGIIVGGWSLAIESGNPVNPVADLAVTGIVVPNPDTTGGNLTYTFNITNNSPATASVVAFTNILPANVSFVSATNSAQAISTTNGSGAVYCIVTNLATGRNVSVTVVVSPNAVGTLTSLGTVTVTGGNSDPNLSNNSATVVTTNIPTANLSVALSGPLDPGVVGGILNYAISVTNNGSGTAFDVVVTDSLGSLNYVLGIPSFTSATGTATINLTNLAPGASASMLLELTPTLAGLITNSVSVSTTSSNLNFGNNTASVVTTVSNAIPNIINAGAKLISGNGPANGAINSGEQVTVSLALANNGSADTAHLVATLLPGNGVSSPSGPQAYGALNSGGASVPRQFTFTGSGVNGGVITAMLQLNDGTANLGTVPFYFNLPATNNFGSGTSIVIPDHGPAAPYPSTINVSGMAGFVSKVTVTLTNLSHQYPSDVEALLVGPTGQTTVLMANNGGPQAITNVMLTFDDAASALLPEAPNVSIVSGIFKPTNDGLAPISLSPAPAPPYGSTLSAFNGTSPNGTWELYVYDISPGDSGSIAGWSLNIESISPINAVANQNPPILSASPSTSGGTFTLKLTGQPEQSYVILASTDLTTWTPVSTNAASVAGVLQFTDTNAANFRHRYYRAYIVPDSVPNPK